MVGQLGLDGAQQPDLGGDLGGQIDERGRGVAAVEVQRGSGGVDPLLRPVAAVVAVRGLADQCGESLGSQPEQGVRVRVAFQHGQVGDPKLPGQWRYGQQLPGQVLDPTLVFRAGPGEPVGGPDPPVERGLLGAGQHQRLQPGWVEQRQPGEGVGVDAVGLGVPGQEPAQVGGLGRRPPSPG